MNIIKSRILAIMFLIIYVPTNGFGQPINQQVREIRSDNILRGPSRHAYETFLKEAAELIHMEIAASELVQEKGSRLEVKKFAAKMVNDNIKIIKSLIEISLDKGFSPPIEPSAFQLVQIKTLTHGMFDTRYVELIGIEVQRDLIKLFKDSAEQVDDADIKEFFAKLIPTFENRLNEAMRLLALMEKSSEK